MRRFYLSGFFVLVVLDTLAQISFKMAATNAAPLAADLAWLGRVACEPWIFVALACYAATFFAWMTLLVRAPLGPAYAASHLEIVVVLVLSNLIFHEQITATKIIGCTLIVVGILCLAMDVARTDQQPAARRTVAN